MVTELAPWVKVVPENLKYEAGISLYILYELEDKSIKCEMGQQNSF